MKTKNCIPLFLKDHEQVLVHIQELEQYVDEFRHKGYSSRRGGQFIKALHALDHEVRVHRKHIGNQDAVLFPLAQRLLTPQQMGEVTRLCNELMATV